MKVQHSIFIVIYFIGLFYSTVTYKGGRIAIQVYKVKCMGKKKEHLHIMPNTALLVSCKRATVQNMTMYNSSEMYYKDVLYSEVSFIV